MEFVWYIDVLRRFWKTIVVVTLVPVVAAVIVTLLLPPTYEAQASIALYRSTLDINFDPRFQTVSEDELVSFNAVQDPRRQTISALATSDEVRQHIIEALPGQSAWSLTDLQNRTQVEVIGNLIQLQVEADDPQQAAIVANIWAEVLQNAANNLFRQQNDVRVVEQQLVTARENYAQAQQTLEQFLNANQIRELKFSIEMGETAVQDIRLTYQTSARDALTLHLTSRDRLSLLINQATSLRNLLTQGSNQVPIALPDQVTLLYLQAGALTASVELPGELQLALPEEVMTGEAAVAHLDDLIDTLMTLEEQFASDIAAQSMLLVTQAQLDVSLAEAITALQVELNSLNAALEAELAQERELTNERDLAWENYQALQLKLAELMISDQITGTEVVLAATAIPPEEASGPSLLLNVVIAFLLGLGVSVVLAFVTVYLRQIETGD